MHTDRQTLNTKGSVCKSVLIGGEWLIELSGEWFLAATIIIEYLNITTQLMHGIIH